MPADTLTMARALDALAGAADRARFHIIDRPRLAERIAGAMKARVAIIAGLADDGKPVALSDARKNIAGRLISLDQTRTSIRCRASCTN